MEIKLIEPSGFCYGVKRALKIVDDLINDENTVKPIYIYGLLIHNKIVIEELEKKAVITLDRNLENLNIKKGTIVFTAHGTSEKIKNIAKHNGLVVVDAICPDVLKTHEIIKENKDKDVLYIGTIGHPESDAALSFSNVKLITSKNCLKNYKNEAILLSQTTMSYFDNFDIYQEASKMNNIKIENEICLATKNRQLALMNANGYDIIFVIGDKLSHNSKVLASLKNNTILIESYKDIDTSILKKNMKIGITAGASTPSSTICEVNDFLEKFNNTL